MARHRTVLTPQERWGLVVRWAGRAALWLALGAAVGLAAWGALTWAGSLPRIRPWVGLAAGLLTAAAAGVASALPATPTHDEATDGPSPS